MPPLYSRLGTLIEDFVSMDAPAACATIVCGLLVVATGCDESDSGSLDHPAAERARAFLQAVQYEDVERAFKLHVESTEHGVYCSSKSFRKVLERTKRQRTEADCRDARTLGLQRRAALADDAELLVQILRFTCGHPEGDCRDYARRVFESQFPESRLWRRLDAFELKQLDRRGDEIVVYVDLTRRRNGSSSVFHRTLTLKRHGGTWYVTDQPDGPEDDNRNE